MENEFFSDNDLKQFYIEQLKNAGISSAADLTEALKNRTVGFNLDIGKIVPPEKQQKILNNNPDFITIEENTYKVEYTYDIYRRKHIASIRMPAEEMFVVQEIPVLPSGRTLTVKVTDGAYEQFSGEDWEELMQKAEVYLINKQWEGFKSSADAPTDQELETYDPIKDTLPELPGPVTFGTNPRTHEPAMAYSALTYNTPYWQGDIAYSIKYYKTQAEALEAQKQALVQIETAKEEQSKKAEEQQLFAPARNALSMIESFYDQIEREYITYGLSWTDTRELRALIYQLKYDIESDPKGVLKRIEEIRNRMAPAIEIIEKKDEVARKVEELTTEKYSVCPLCGRDLSDGTCQNQEHNVKTIQFETDEYGRKTRPVRLSQIIVRTKSEGNKIVVRLMCSAGTDRKHNKGDIYLERGSDLRYDERWEGQIGDVVFEDHGGINIQDTASPEVSSAMAYAFKRAAGEPTEEANILPSTQEEDELNPKKRKQLEELVKETGTKINNRLKELDQMLEREKATALNVSNGEIPTGTDIAKHGVRVVASFDNTDDQGYTYAEVVDWSSNKVLHLRAHGLQKTQYVEIVGPVENGAFHSDELDLDGITLEVKLVDLAENDMIVKDLKDKLGKLRKRLGQ